jgi:hypothetical protein
VPYGALASAAAAHRQLLLAVGPLDPPLIDRIIRAQTVFQSKIFNLLEFTIP